MAVLVYLLFSEEFPFHNCRINKDLNCVRNIIEFRYEFRSAEEHIIGNYRNDSNYFMNTEIFQHFQQINSCIHSLVNVTEIEGWT